MSNWTFSGIKPTSVLRYELEQIEKIKLKEGMIFYDKNETKCKIVDVTSDEDKVGVQYFDHRKKEYRTDRTYYWHRGPVKMRVAEAVKHSPLYKVLNE
jgi:hypothetical protein